MANNFRAPGDKMPFTVAGSPVVAGQLHLVGDAVGVVSQGAAVGATGVLCFGIFDPVPCLSTDVIAEGVRLYYDAAESRLTLTATGNRYAGLASRASGGTDATCGCNFGKGSAPDGS